MKNLDPRFRNAAYDPGNQYSIPWQWGTTGIGFDKTKVGGEVTDWDAFDLAGGQGQVVVPRRGARRVRDGVVRAEEGPEHHRTTATSTTPRTTSST